MFLFYHECNNEWLWNVFLYNPVFYQQLLQMFIMKNLNKCASSNIILRIFSFPIIILDIKEKEDFIHQLPANIVFLPANKKFCNYHIGSASVVGR